VFWPCPAPHLQITVLQVNQRKIAIRVQWLLTVQFIPAPVVAAPAPQPLRTWIGGGYDPSKFIPRQYGENTFTPGIAHIPTSIVDRSPERADQVLNSGRTVPQAPAGYGGVAPRTPTYHIAQNAGPNAQFIQGPIVAGPVLSGPVFGQGVAALPTSNFAAGPHVPVQFNPAYGQASFSQASLGQPTAPVVAQNGTFASNVGADGTYWEKTSGLTTFGSTVATQVICKRKLPTQVVNPVIGVPTPVCQIPGHGPHNAHGGFQGGQQFAPNNVGYGAPAQTGAWTY